MNTAQAKRILETALICAAEPLPVTAMRITDPTRHIKLVSKM
jgi:hypothetical protein